MKSLYSILGLSPDVTADQIEVAYAELLTKLQGDDDPNQEADKKIRLVAIKEAYSVLSDPVSRQRYNNKLFASNISGLPETKQIDVDSAADNAGIKKWIVIGGIVVVSIGMYSYHAQEREKLKIQHEKEIKLRALQVEEDRQRRLAEEQEVRLARQAQFDSEARERAQRVEQERYMRDFEIRQRSQEREEEFRMQRERNEKLRQAREEEMQRTREMAEARNRVMRDKMELQRIERERYGRVITR